MSSSPCSPMYEEPNLGDLDPEVPEVSEEAILQSPEFRALRASLPASLLSDEDVIVLMRKKQEENAQEARKSTETFRAGFNAVIALDPGRQNLLLLIQLFFLVLRKLYADLGSVAAVDVSFEASGKVGVSFRSARAARWYDATWASYIGNYESHYLSARYPESNGLYKLAVLPARTAQEGVHIQLHEPSGRILSYPPAVKGQLVDTPMFTEVTSVTRMQDLTTLKAGAPLHAWFKAAEKAANTSTESISE